MKYSIVIMQTEEGEFRGACPFIPEAEAQGKSYDECQESMLKAVDRCVRQRVARGESLPDETKMRPVNVFYVPYVNARELVGIF